MKRAVLGKASVASHAYEKRVRIDGGRAGDQVDRPLIFSPSQQTKSLQEKRSELPFVPTTARGNVPPPTRDARVAVSSMPRGTDSVADLELLLARSDGAHLADKLVPGRARVLDTGESAVLRDLIAW
jgi:hypothetical protein